MKFSHIKIGMLSFVIVLLLMPLGHALMILNEKMFANYKLTGAFVIGLIGVILLIFGMAKTRRPSTATLLGLLAGVLLWTGWIEFSFVWIAEKQHISALIEHGEVVTKPEYLIMPSSLGLLSAFCLLFLFTPTKCQFFNWFQRRLAIIPKGHYKKPIAIVTFIETIMVLWTFYVLLLLAYDRDIAGDQHPFTYIVALGSLFWACYLFLNLIKINKFDYAIRYAIPTVIIFWNFVEVLGRWNLFKEIWIHPVEHWIEILIGTLLLIAFTAYYIVENRKDKSGQKQIV